MLVMRFAHGLLAFEDLGGTVGPALRGGAFVRLGGPGAGLADRLVAHYTNPYPEFSPYRESAERNGIISAVQE